MFHNKFKIIIKDGLILNLIYFVFNYFFLMLIQFIFPGI